MSCKFAKSWSYLPYFLLFLFFLIVASFFTPGLDGSNMWYDTRVTYTKCIETEVVTDWHSALYMYEGIGLKRIIACFYEGVSGWMVIKLMSIIQLLLMFVGIGYLISICRLKVWLSCLLVIFINVILISEAGFFTWVLDISFLCVLIALIACTVALYRVKSRCCYIGLWGCAIILLWHCVEYRKNSVVVVPWIIFTMLYSLKCFRQISWKKMAIWVMILTSVCVALFMSLVRLIFPVTHSSPQTPMMVSDLRIAYILMGREDDLLTVPALPSVYADWDKTITAYPRYLRPDADYKKFEDFYLDNWQMYPQEMLTAKALQMMQFYTGGKTPKFVQKMVHMFYPSVEKNPDAWKEYRTYGMPIILLIGRIIPLFIVAVLTVVAISYIRLRGMEKSRFDLFFVYVGCITLLYALSFMVVTPTPDDRYLMPSLIICKIMISVWIYRVLYVFYEKLKDDHKAYRDGAVMD